MLSKNKIKFIQSLFRKKFREEHSLFIAEGNKLVSEIMKSDFVVQTIVASPEWLSNNRIHSGIEIIETDLPGMKKVSALSTPTDVLAIIEQPKWDYSIAEINNKLSIVLDDIQDPGNLGTIIRLCDWFGIEHVFCSQETVEVFNPKVVQATMGAILRVKIHYCDLPELLEDASAHQKFPIYGTYMTGVSIYAESLSANGFILMGNEGKGISPNLKKYISKSISIPSFSSSRGSESLNVAMSTGIILSEFKRKGIS